MNNNDTAYLFGHSVCIVTTEFKTRQCDFELERSMLTQHSVEFLSSVHNCVSTRQGWHWLPICFTKDLSEIRPCNQILNLKTYTFNQGMQHNFDTALNSDTYWYRPRQSIQQCVRYQMENICHCYCAILPPCYKRTWDFSLPWHPTAEDDVYNGWEISRRWRCFLWRCRLQIR